MNLGLVAPTYPPDRRGGIETIVRAEARALADAGHEVRVIAATGWARGGTRAELDGELDGVPVTWLPLQEEELEADAASRPRWTRLAVERLRGCDAVHVHHGPTLSDDLVRAVSRRVPCVISLHDHAFELARPALDEPNPALRGARRERRKSFLAELAAADRVLVSSAAQQEVLQGHLPGSLVDRLAVHVPASGFRVPEGYLASRREPWRGNRPLSILSFGRRSEEKGALDLVRSLMDFDSAAVELIFCGATSSREFDQRLRDAAGGRFKVHLFGAYEDEQLASLAAACDLAAFPARLPESDALVVEEALSLALPVWVTPQADPHGLFDRGPRDSRSAPSTLESAPGRVLPARRPDAWSEALSELFADPSAHRRERDGLGRWQRRLASESALELATLFADLTQLALPPAALRSIPAAHEPAALAS